MEDSILRGQYFNEGNAAAGKTPDLKTIYEHDLR